MRTRAPIRSKVMETYLAAEGFSLRETGVGARSVLRVGVDKLDCDAVSVPDLLGGHETPLDVRLFAHIK